MSSTTITIDINRESDILTDKVIQHFVNDCDAHGYYYKDQDYYFKKIIKKHLESLQVNAISKD